MLAGDVQLGATLCVNVGRRCSTWSYFVCKCWQEMFNLEHISDAPNNKPDLQAILAKERQKALKKRFKKLRQRMVFRWVRVLVQELRQRMVFRWVRVLVQELRQRMVFRWVRVLVQETQTAHGLPVSESLSSRTQTAHGLPVSESRGLFTHKLLL